MSTAARGQLGPELWSEYPMKQPPKKRGQPARARTPAKKAARSTSQEAQKWRERQAKIKKLMAMRAGEAPDDE